MPPIPTQYNLDTIYDVPPVADIRDAGVRRKVAALQAGGSLELRHNSRGWSARWYGPKGIVIDASGRHPGSLGWKIAVHDLWTAKEKELSNRRLERMQKKTGWGYMVHFLAPVRGAANGFHYFYSKVEAMNWASDIAAKRGYQSVESFQRSLKPSERFYLCEHYTHL